MGNERLCIIYYFVNVCQLMCMSCLLHVYTPIVFPGDVTDKHGSRFSLNVHMSIFIPFQCLFDFGHDGLANLVYITRVWVNKHLLING